MSVLLVVRGEEDREFLVNIATQIARSQEAQLHVLQLDGSECESHSSELVWVESESLKVCTIHAANVKSAIKDAESTLKPDTLIMQDASEYVDAPKGVINDLMQDICCEFIVVRVGERALAEDLGRILVPCSGGRHSRAALNLASKLSPSQATALFVAPDVDVVSESVGFSHLHRYVNRAGLSLEDVRCHVELEDDPYLGMRKEAEQGDYGLMIVGASGYRSVRQKLFGILPEKIMKGEDGMSVAVLRAARPIRYRFKDKFERLLHLNVPQLSRDERVVLFGGIEEKSKWSFDFAVLMVLATAIAGLGLLADSVAVVIGAMLVAPLMMPLLGGGLSLVQGNWPLWKKCQAAVLLGFLSALIISVLLGLIARILDMSLTSELLARGEPSTLDLGVAFISGVAASYCLARPKLSGALAGVAIAAALVPPIATTGICLALGQIAVAQGAALLFGANAVAIVLGAAVNFYIAGIRGRNKTNGVWAQRFFIVFALSMAGLVGPLSSVRISRITGPEEVKIALKREACQYGITIKKVLKGSKVEGVQEIEIVLEASKPLSKAILKELKRTVEAALQSPVKLKLRTLLVEEF